MKPSRARRFSFAPLFTLAGVGVAVFGLARRRDPQFFSGKVVVLAGGSRGLGLAMARILHAEGANLALLARDADELDRARRDLIGGTARQPKFSPSPATSRNPTRSRPPSPEPPRTSAAWTFSSTTRARSRSGRCKTRTCRISRRP